MISGKRPVLVACLLAVLLLVGTVHPVVAAQTTEVERAQERLQAANRAYQTALVTVDVAQEAGVETGEFDERLDEADEALTDGVDAVRATPPDTERALEAATRAERLSLAVEEDATVATQQALADAAIERERARLSSSADEWLQRAEADRADGQFAAVERDLQYAQHAAQATHYEAYLQNLSAQGLDPVALDAEVAAFDEAVESGTLAPREASQLRQSMRRADVCVRRLHAATLAIERADQTSSVLVSADLTAATAAHQEGYDALERGEYDVACRAAETAQTAADSETRRVQSTLETDVLAKTVDAVYDTLRAMIPGFGDDTVASTTVVHPPTLVVVDVSPVSVTVVPPTPSVTPLDFTAEAVTTPVPSEPDEQVVDDVDATPEREETAKPERAQAEPVATAEPERAQTDRVEQPVREETVRFVIRIDGVDECGTTCRDVTGTLRNVGTGDAHNVEVDMALSVDGSVLWTGTQSLGTVPAGETRTISQRIVLGFGEALQARSNGTVDVLITVRSDEETQTIRDTVAV
ncbi:coiled-coil domain-containing protein [Halogranum rubrum]|uniref:Uncharacterized protein n=1 Tax=Halogranum salarium B-1 TaxID=1210908 RepID=J2ZYJ1_9EURY|nr:hypothetical protein [Halogranum salarium]EJN58083.1 hypothetical protein HSB1_35000 [Halogranum salarium B-1]